MDPLQESYEALPYDSEPIPHSHPDALATAARLRGLEPAAVERCRVLELGCAEGGNLLPMAVALPESRFVGLDLSAAQIDVGRATVAALGLPNLELQARDLLEIDEIEKVAGGSIGEFDYILCHGVYSWCPPVVQAKILSILQQHLAPEGVAYLSWNTFPGWHGPLALREMMVHHVRAFREPVRRVKEARAFLDFLSSAIPDDNKSHRAAVVDLQTRLAKQSDTYFFHEYLEAFNQPLYFHEFAQRIADAGLQYLGESCEQPTVSDLLPEAQAALGELDGVGFEQYLDFVRNRKFRRSLLCRAGKTLCEPAPRLLAGLHLAAVAQPVSPKPKVKAGRAEQFRTGVATVTTDDPYIKALLLTLHDAWPRYVEHEALDARLEALVGPIAPDDIDAVVLHCYAANLIGLHVHAPRMTLTPGTHPLASPLARLQAQHSKRVSNLRHLSVELAEPDRILLQKLDGQTSCVDLGPPATVDVGLQRLAASSLLLQ